MIMITSDFVLNALKHDFKNIIDANPHMLKEKNVFVFIECFTKVWLEYAKKNYTWHNHLFYSLTHSYRTVFLVSEFLDEMFKILKDMDKSEISFLNKQPI